MDKIIMIIIKLFVFQLLTYGQITKVFIYRITKNTNVSILLNTNYTYIIYYITDTGEQTSFLELSFGKFSENPKGYSLIDEIHKFNIILENKDGKLVVKKFYPFLLGKEFVYSEEINEDQKITHNYKRADLSNYKKNYSVLQYGLYCFGNLYFLEIMKDGNYIYKYNNFVISKGNWTQNNNEIIFNDSLLKYKFYGIVSENTIISNIFPVDCEGVVLKYKPDSMHVR